MTQSEPPKKPSNPFRERLVARYHAVFESLNQQQSDEHSSTAAAPDHPHSPYDVTLAAFAQLAALRLNAARALISLIDSESQYVLAEATGTSSLQSDLRQSKEHALLQGSVVIPRKSGICEVILIDDSSSDRPETTRGNDVITITNLTEDSRYRDYAVVTSGPRLRFYAGAPIKSMSGTTIGAFCVVDVRVRPDLTSDEEGFLKGMASSAMDHLEALKTQAEHKRRSGLVTGLESFTSGLSELSQHPLATEASGRVDSESTEPRAKDSLSNGSSAGDQTQELQSNPRAEENGSTHPAALWEEALAPGSKEMFSRAAKIIRQGGDYDGVAFFYMTNQTSDNNLRGADPSVRVADRGAPSGELATNSSIRETDSSSSDAQPDEKLVQDSVSRRSNAELADNVPCPILGSSLKATDTAARRREREQLACFTSRDLESTLGKRPRAKTISINESGGYLFGETSSSGSSLEQNSTPYVSEIVGIGADAEAVAKSRRRKTKQSRIASLRKLNPTAKSFVVLPLWDYERAKWFASCVCWYKVARNDIDLNGDLQYLRIFGNSISIALSRLDSAMADRSKQSFVESISHELRSPLHGILGAVDFLHDTSLSRFQQEMVGSILNCGRTLLDTLEHVMDYAKISLAPSQSRAALLKASRDGLSAKNYKGDAHPIAHGASVFDMSALTEEAVEAVWSGFCFQGRIGKAAAGDLRLASQHAKLQDPSNTFHDRGRLRIALQIPHRSNWFVETKAGALRRIIMNLFGNALKYTTDGLVTVDIRVESEESEMMNLVLSVTDTGCGISQMYQRNHLFRPFSQENILSPGSGLGLSIVKQLADDLGGRVLLKSSKGSGTHVGVSLSLSTAQSVSSPGPHEAFSSEALKESLFRTRVHVFCGRDTEVLSDRERRLQKSETEQLDILRSLLTGWFGIKSDLVTSWQRGAADIVIFPEPSFKLLNRIEETETEAKKPGVLLIASDSVEMSALRFDERILTSPLVIETVTQPFGPRKLALALKRILDRQLLSEPRPIRERRTSVIPPAESTMAPALPAQTMASQGARIAMDRTISDWSIRLDSPTALLVDDNEINLRLLAAFVKKVGVAFKEAVNGKEAVDLYKAAAGTFLVVFMDISMPVMNGVAATQRIRQYEEEAGLQRAPVIALTGLASAAAQNEAQEAGVDDYLTKPFNFGRIRAIIETQLESRTAPSA